MTPEQIELAFVSVLGVHPRSVDLAVIQTLGATPEAVAEYLWDHWLGEPEAPTVEQVLIDVKGAMK